MKTKQINPCIIAATLAFVAFTGCKKDEPSNNNTTTPGAYDSGVFITCEGAFTGGTGTVSFYNRTNKAVSNDIFQTANNIPLGNVVQSMSIFNSKGYIVVNNAGKVEVVNAGDFKSSGTITGFNQPRYFLGINSSKAYVSEWGLTGFEGAVKVVNLSNNSITSTISTGKGAEHMVKSGDFAYVACSGGYGIDSTLTVINTVSDTISAKITIGDNPNSLQIDANGKLWVLCGGINDYATPANNTAGKLICMNTSGNIAEFVFTFPSTSSHPSGLVINSAKNKLYYNYDGKVYVQDITAGSLNTTETINRSFYGLGIDPSNDYIFASDAEDFSSNGWVFRYNTTGSVVDSFQVGIIPGNFYFK